MSCSNGRPKFAKDVQLLFATRILRLFAYGAMAVTLALYLSDIGLSPQRMGMLLSLTLWGDTIISLWMTTSADRKGRRSMLVAGAGLMVFAGCMFIATRNFWLLLVAAIIGVISPSGYEVGPFLSIEQAALSQITPAQQHIKLFSWYNLVGSFAVALGTLAGGALEWWSHSFGLTPFAGYRIVLITYAGVGLLLAALFLRLSPAVEVTLPTCQERLSKKTLLGLHESRSVVFKLSALFSLDSFAGGFVMQSLLAYWFHVRFGIDVAHLGAIFFGANILAGISALSAAWIASKIGLVNTMVFTHIPSNLLLILVPLMPTATLAITVLLLRFGISQMDVPTRQAYTVSIVQPDERAAAAGVSGIARTIGSGISPMIVGPLLARPALVNVPFFAAGILKILYDLLLYHSFKSTNQTSERKTAEKP